MLESKEAPMLKTSPIRLAVSIELRLAADRQTQTDRHRAKASTRLVLCRAGKNSKVLDMDFSCEWKWCVVLNCS